MFNANVVLQFCFIINKLQLNLFILNQGIVKIKILIKIKMFMADTRVVKIY